MATNGLGFSIHPFILFAIIIIFLLRFFACPVLELRRPISDVNATELGGDNVVPKKLNHFNILVKYPQHEKRTIIS